jgi:MscS family membrane protein
VLTTFLLSIVSAASAGDNYRLRPPDTSSPRATLEGFIATFDDIYGRLENAMEDYAESDRLYMTTEERRQQLTGLGEAPKALRYLDISGIPPVLSDIVPVERALQLKEILDRIQVPPFAEIPDQEAMARQSEKRWRLPNTEIDIVRIERGPHAGEYLVSAETIERLPEFYERVKDLPYQPGPGKLLATTYRKLSRDASATIYDAFLSSPIGFSLVFPPRWMLSLPDWVKVRVGGPTAWQWLGLAIGLLVSGLIIWLAHRVGRRRSDASEEATGPHWSALLVPLAIVFVASLLLPFLDGLLRIGGSVRMIIEYTRTGALFLSAAWLALVTFAILGETIAASDRMHIRSLDNQLIRLGTRLIGVVVAIVILMYGGDELGFPTYSVLAGLGVGGLAVALAAQTTIANLIGSLLIAMEKPFRVGQYVRIGTSEGTVEDVGFRSTRIRTLDNSLVSIPSSTVVNTTVENLSARNKRRQRLLVQVTYNTPRDKMEELVSGISDLLANNLLVEHSSYEVRFNNFAESSLDILVIFHLVVEDYASELASREAVLLQIMDLVNKAGVEFAFPTQTLYVQNSAQSSP